MQYLCIFLFNLQINDLKISFDTLPVGLYHFTVLTDVLTREFSYTSQAVSVCYYGHKLIVIDDAGL